MRRTARSAPRAGALTNTPLQALVLLNDPTYVEAARALAERAMLEGGRDAAAARDRFAFRLATARRADGTRNRRCCASSRKQRLEHVSRAIRDRRAQAAGGRRVAARSASSIAAELAAWTTVASVILNLDETITKE